MSEQAVQQVQITHVQKERDQADFEPHRKRNEEVEEALPLELQA